MFNFTKRAFTLLLLAGLIVFTIPAAAQDQLGKIAYTAVVNGVSQINLVDLSGNAVNISDGQGNDSSPSLSPDGQQVVFASDRTGNLEIYVAASDGTNMTQLTTNGYNNAYPSWSPDGTQIAFSSDHDGDFDIYTTDLQGNVNQLTNSDSREWSPAWSPDGRQIAYVSDVDVDYEIYVMDVNGKGAQNITNNPTDDGNPSCRPMGRKSRFRQTVWAARRFS